VNEPLSYAPAGSSVVILSLVPMVRVPPPPPEEPPLSSLLLPPHAVSTRAVAATPAVATTRRRLLEPDLIRYLVFRRRPAGTANMRHRGHLANGGSRSNTVSEQ
jgi:hypothetical protein